MLLHLTFLMGFTPLRKDVLYTKFIMHKVEPFVSDLSNGVYKSGEDENKKN